MNSQIQFSTSSNEVSVSQISSDEIAVTAVNDHHVFAAWAKATGAEGHIDFLADGAANFAKAAGLSYDAEPSGMGVRSRRYSALVEDGIVKQLNIEETTGKADLSGAAHILAQL